MMVEGKRRASPNKVKYGDNIGKWCRGRLAESIVLSSSSYYLPWPNVVHLSGPSHGIVLKCVCFDPTVWTLSTGMLCANAARLQNDSSIPPATFQG